MFYSIHKIWSLKNFTIYIYTSKIDLFHRSTLTTIPIKAKSCSFHQHNDMCFYSHTIKIAGSLNGLRGNDALRFLVWLELLSIKKKRLQFYSLDRSAPVASYSCILLLLSFLCYESLQNFIEIIFDRCHDMPTCNPVYVSTNHGLRYTHSHFPI
jgi:hypothetical protein